MSRSRDFEYDAHVRKTRTAQSAMAMATAAALKRPRYGREERAAGEVWKVNQTKMLGSENVVCACVCVVCRTHRRCYNCSFQSYLTAWAGDVCAVMMVMVRSPANKHTHILLT